jgi:sulfite exporter TauE/SafE
MERLGHVRSDTVELHRGGDRRQAWRGVARSGGIGLAWVAWPCGLLQSALLVAALANTAGQGALVMAGFAAASSLGLVAGPALWRRIGGGAGSVWWSGKPAVRLAGLALAAASAWALGHGLWMRVAAWCFG